MANKKINELNELIKLNNNDLFVVYDISESGSEETKKITKANAFNGLSLDGHVHDAYLPLTGGHILGDLTIEGNLTITGAQLVASVQEIQVEDNLILLNKNETGAGVTAGIAGLEIERGTATNYKFIFEELTDTFKIGLDDDLQPVATREDNPIDNGIPFWNNTLKRFDTENTFTKQNILSVSTAPNEGDSLVYNGTIWMPVPTIGTNFIINGEMAVWQRGTNFNPATKNTYTADRWKYEATTSASVQIFKSSDIPSNQPFRESLGIKVLVPESPIANSNFCLLSTTVEGYDYRNIFNRTVTLSFWVKCSTTGTFCVTFRTGDPTLNKSYVVEISVDQANSWLFKTITLSLTGNSTPNFHEGRGINIAFCLGAGANFITTKNSWQNGNYMASSLQSNFIGITNFELRITGIKLELGNVFTTNNGIVFAELLTRCQRYYEKSYNLGVAPGSPTYDGRPPYAHARHRYSIPGATFKVPKRISPVVTLYSPQDGAAGYIVDTGEDINIAAHIENGGENGFPQVRVPSGVLEIDTIYVYHWSADADF